MDKGKTNILRSARRKKEETSYSEGERENGTWWKETTSLGHYEKPSQAVRYHETVYGTTDQAAPATNSTMVAMI